MPLAGAAHFTLCAIANHLPLFIGESDWASRSFYGQLCVSFYLWPERRCQKVLPRSEENSAGALAAFVHPGRGCLVLWSLRSRPRSSAFACLRILPARFAACGRLRCRGAVLPGPVFPCRLVATGAKNGLAGPALAGLARPASAGSDSGPAPRGQNPAPKMRPPACQPTVGWQAGGLILKPNLVPISGSRFSRPGMAAGGHARRRPTATRRNLAFRLPPKMATIS